MTIGPDLDWLADAEGNLRPQVARDLLEAQPPPAPRQPATPPAQPPIPTVPQPRRPVAQPFGPAVRVSGASIPVVPILLGVIVALVGFALGTWFAQRPIANNEELTMAPVTAPAARAMVVNGVNVNVRSGPGLNFPPILKLTPGESLLVRAEQEGWCAVTTNTGTSGWVFGAFLRGHGNADQGAAIVTQLLTSSGDVQRVVLRPGDKVFVVQNGDGRAGVILPTGRRLSVAPEALIRVE